MDSNIISSFPKPPLLYINRYTEINLQNQSELPFSLKPPPIPSDNYINFGINYDSKQTCLTTLEELNIRRLYPSKHNPKQELEKILKSIIMCYFDLIDILIQNPDSTSRVEKLEDLNLLFINFSHLVNEFRPIQAKHHLISLLQKQLNERKRIATDLKQSTNDVTRVLSGLKDIKSWDEDISKEISENKQNTPDLLLDLIAKDQILYDSI